jgi:GNAT superfamily N-acetyltransferase
LAVAHDYRGKGIGKRLIDDCAEGLAKAGLKRAIILVAGDNPTGRDFWLRNGWELIDLAIPMGKDL